MMLACRLSTATTDMISEPD